MARRLSGHLTRGKCPHCEEVFLVQHHIRWAWCSHVREVVPKPGAIDERYTARLINQHIEWCLDNRLEREYGSLDPLGLWAAASGTGWRSR